MVSVDSNPKFKTHALAYLAKAVSSNHARKHLIQSTTLRAKCKRLLASNFESYKPEDDDPLP